MSERFDIAVIGAGPAGAMAALGAARRGARVLLVEKAAWPRDKVCGSTLNRDAVATLERAGLGHVVREQGALPLEQVRFFAGGRRADVRLPGAKALSRRALDAGLVAAARAAGVVFCDETAAGLGELRDDAHEVVLRGGGGERRVSARAIVVADGLAGSFLRGCAMFDVRAVSDGRMGVGAVADGSPTAFRLGVIYMACGAGGYVGAVRLEDGRLNFGGALGRSYVQQCGGPGAAVAAVLMEAGADGDELARELDWRGTPTLRRVRRPVAAERIFLVGDAAGYVEPFTGEGIAWALASGEAVVDVALQAAAGWEAALARAWARRYRRLLRRRQWQCRAMAAVLGRPRLTRSLVAAVGAAPVLARPVVSLYTAVHEPAGLGEAI